MCDSYFEILASSSLNNEEQSSINPAFPLSTVNCYQGPKELASSKILKPV